MLFAKHLLLFLILLHTTTMTITKVYGKPCPPCGTKLVPYPLSTDGTCGDPLYKIRCYNDSSTLIFDSVNNSYTITSISSSGQRLTIAPAPLLGNDSCISSDLTTNGLELDPFLPFKITMNNTLMLYNCTPSILLSPLNCSWNSLCHFYANNSNSDMSMCGFLPICCTFFGGSKSMLYSIQINSQSCSVYQSFVNVDLTQKVETWTNKSGVELEWALPREPICETQADCEDGKNATCVTDPTSSDESVKRCFCVRSFVWDPFSGKCVQNETNCKITGTCKKSNRGPFIAVRLNWVYVKFGLKETDGFHHILVSGNNYSVIRVFMVNSGLASGLGGALLVSTAGILIYIRQHRIRQRRARMKREREEIMNLNNTSGRTVKNFTSREMKRATSNFSHNNLLGSGGFGDVYKGMLPDGTLIAVKCAKLGNTKSMDQVLNEVRILSQVNHRSLVHLLGCCVDLDQPLMVYEFISNGTLAEHLHRIRSPLSWRHRLSIAHQTAQGLAYLHFSAVPPIYHRDVKSSNILLDERLHAKVSDFGLSRLIESEDQTHITTCAQGTLGYVDPEYYRNFQLTDKSDVYSFGVVLLEILTAQKAIDFRRPADDVNLSVYMLRLVEEERLMEALDPTLMKNATQIEIDTMQALGFLAVSCLEEKRQNRPSMKEVAEEIEYIITLLDSSSVDQTADKISNFTLQLS